VGNKSKVFSTILFLALALIVVLTPVSGIPLIIITDEDGNLIQDNRDQFDEFGRPVASANPDTKLQITTAVVTVNEREERVTHNDVVGNIILGDRITFSLTIRNQLNTMLEDIRLTAENNKLDVDEEEELDVLEPGKEATLAIDFTIDDATDSGTYSIRIKVEAEDNGQTVQDELTVSLTVDRKSHELQLGSLQYPTYIRCNREPVLDIGIANTGEHDELYAAVVIENALLQVHSLESFVLHQDKSTTKSLRLSIPNNVPESEYIFTIKSLYDKTVISNQKEIKITIKDCPVLGLTADSPTLEEPVKETTPVLETQTFQREDQIVTFTVPAQEAEQRTAYQPEQPEEESAIPHEEDSFFTIAALSLLFLTLFSLLLFLTVYLNLLFRK